MHVLFPEITNNPNLTIAKRKRDNSMECSRIPAKGIIKIIVPYKWRNGTSLRKEISVSRTDIKRSIVNHWRLLTN